jgi:diguanylate cyclase
MPRIMALGGMIRRRIGAWRDWLSPPVPADIRAMLRQAQFDSVRRQIPMLLSVAALNTLIIIAVCAHRGLPVSHYAWMGGLIAYCVVRIAMWTRQTGRPLSEPQMIRLLRINVYGSCGMISLLGLAVAATFVIGTFDAEILIPMSLGFGATSIAHCMYTLRPAALGALIMGLVPPSLAMLAVGGFDAKMLAVSMLSVGFLMAQFVAAQYDQLIVRLRLEKQAQDLANTDALTGLANRRAVMARLEALENAVAPFAVALIDLNGFKQVNDTLGHHIGDDLLVEVGARLSAIAGDDFLVGRLGGDEFIAVFPCCTDARAVSAHSVALLASLSQPAQIDGHVVPVGASLGSALSGVDGDSVDALLQHADRALYAAKRGVTGMAEQVRAA